MYFQNTWWRVLSHASIYVGNGYVIETANPGAGVRKSSIYSPYHINRWWGGRGYRQRQIASKRERSGLCSSLLLSTAP